MESDSDSDCWYNKDEEELLANVKSEEKSVEEEPETSKENLVNEYNLQKSKYFLGKNSKNSKVNTSDLITISKLKPLDQFLSIIEPNYLDGIINITDSHKRVLHYLKILKNMSDLELPIFHIEILQYFTNDNNLLIQINNIMLKLFDKKYANIFDNNDYIKEIINNLQTLIQHSFRMQLLNAACLKTIRHICDRIKSSNNQKICNMPECIEFKEQLLRILQDEGEKQKKSKMTDEGEYQYNDNDVIYPTLDELLLHSNDNSKIKNNINGDTVDESTKDVIKYINRQKYLLREDFMVQLRDFVRSVRKEESFNIIEHNKSLFKKENVYIVLNEQFFTAQRHEMLFLDIVGEHNRVGHNRKVLKHKELNNLKTGCLLCFTTSWEFDDLILATITYTHRDITNCGYIGIEIVRQYNIGNIYNRSFICFETPAFFEPYQNVYNSLKKCGIENFPMKDYFIDGKSEINSPSYLNNQTKYLIDGKWPFKPLIDSPSKNSLKMNSSQIDAFSASLKNELALIQGPPGTGKTYLSIELVKTLISNTDNKPIVIITYTNESLDKFLLKISSHTHNILRFGQQTRLKEISKFNVPFVVDKHLVNPKVKRLYYLVQLELKEKFAILQNLHKQFDGTDKEYHKIVKAQNDVNIVRDKLNCIRGIFQYYMACKADIIAMTTTCAAKMNFLFRLLKSPIVIFEEAGEILESHILACLTPYTKHIIMIGDHLQLKPYTSSFGHSRLSKLNISLFERLISEVQIKYSVLKIQYRMRPAICDLLCGTIYKELHNDHIVSTYPIVQKMSANLYFLTHNRKEEIMHKTSITNMYEVTKGLELVEYLLTIGGYLPSDIVLLSPYAEQINTFQRNMSKYCINELNAHTVDSFQGLEANIVILSLVRCNDFDRIGFLNENNRICVALSRAKYGLYIIGNIELLMKASDTWKMIGQILQKHNAVGNEFPYSYDESTISADNSE